MPILRAEIVNDAVVVALSALAVAFAVIFDGAEVVRSVIVHGEEGRCGD